MENHGLVEVKTENEDASEMKINFQIQIKLEPVDDELPESCSSAYEDSYDSHFVAVKQETYDDHSQAGHSSVDASTTVADFRESKVLIKAIDTTATSAVASSFLSLYSGAMSSACTSVSSSASTSLATAAHSKAAADTTRPATSPALDNPLLNNNSLKLDNANGNTGSKTASPASSPAPLFRPSFPNTFGNPPTFGRQSSSTNPTSALSSTALLSTLTAMPPTGVGVNAAMAAYQSALLSAMAAHTHTFPNLTAPTDLSLKTSVSTPLHATSTSSSLSGSGSQKSSLLSHKLSGAEVGAVRQLITGYRESAAFLLRSADELEALLLNQP